MATQDKFIMEKVQNKLDGHERTTVGWQTTIVVFHQTPLDQSSTINFDTHKKLGREKRLKNYHQKHKIVQEIAI